MLKCNKILRYLTALQAFSLITAGNAGILLASDKVSSPNIEEGKMDFEYRSGYDFDDNPSKDHLQSHKLVLNYGISPNLRPEIKIIADSRSAAEVAGGEISLRWQFLKQEEAAWLSAALDHKYKFFTEAEEAGAFEVRLLANKKSGPFSHTGNIGLEEQLGEHSRNGLAMELAWKSSYKINSHLSPGIEFYGSTGQLRDRLTYDEQKYRIGPNLSGSLTDSIKYDMGYIFGISEAATDGRIKFILVYSKKF